VSIIFNQLQIMGEILLSILHPVFGLEKFAAPNPFPFLVLSSVSSLRLLFVGRHIYFMYPKISQTGGLLAAMGRGKSFKHRLLRLLK